MNCLRINNLSKSYGSVEALKNVTLDISPGIYGLLGPNGAGKTTMMRIITTVLNSTAGEINFKNINWSNKDEVRRNIGYLPQKFYLYKNITVLEALRHIAVLKELKDIRDELLLEILARVNLEDCKNKRIGELSGGMVRRFGIAQSILGDPDILVIDEPTAGLDPEERIRFRNMLCTLPKEKIIILSTHLVEDIETTCSKAGVLNKGQLIFNGEIPAIKEKAEGKVWECTCDDRVFNELSSKFEISYSYRERYDLFKLKILCREKPYESATLASPSTEDGYLCLIKNI